MKKNLNVLGDLWEKLMNMLSTTHEVGKEMLARGGVGEGRLQVPTKTPASTYL